MNRDEIIVFLGSTDYEKENTLNYLFVCGKHLPEETNIFPAHLRIQLVRWLCVCQLNNSNGCKRRAKCVSTIECQGWMVSLNVKIRILSEQTRRALRARQQMLNRKNKYRRSQQNGGRTMSTRISSIKQYSTANNKKINKDPMRAIHVWKRKQSHTVCKPSSGSSRFLMSELIELFGIVRECSMANGSKIDTFRIRNEVNKFQRLKSTKTKH